MLWIDIIALKSFANIMLLTKLVIQALKMNNDDDDKENV